MDDKKKRELEDERSMQRQYRREVTEDAAKPRRVEGPANTLWTGSGLPRAGVRLSGDLLGRVAIRKPEEVFDGKSEFYVGDKRHVVNGSHVISWTAPMASVFFRADARHDLYDEVLVTRTFRLRRQEIESFVDEAVSPDAPQEPFARRALQIPKPPTRRDLPIRPPDNADNADNAGNAGSQSVVDSSGDARVSRRSDGPSTTAAKGPQSEPIRAEALLREALEAPRTAGLQSVLSTLQPDQYRLVTTPPAESIVIEGRPGTGKTIVGTHRAAYLVHPDTPDEIRVSGVLIVGPTPQYSDHVRAVVQSLAGSGRILVRSLPEIVAHYLELKRVPDRLTTDSWQDADANLAILARSAVLRVDISKTGKAPIRSAYEILRSNGGADDPLTQEREWSDYLRTLPSYESAVSRRLHLVLRAFIAMEIGARDPLGRVDHVIVDEGQDVTPLEWMLLASINPSGRWTILGDLNQRRSDFTLASWRHLSDQLAIASGGLETYTLDRGYRSTRPILEYAARLLGRGRRKVHAFQGEGPEPRPIRVRPGDLDSRVVEEMDRLLDTHSSGTVAVIAEDVGRVRTSLSRVGWRAQFGGMTVWERNDRSVRVFTPDAVRGLEFDAVVVVEPSDFPENFGRKGVLYTSLTRANRELVIVHSKPLPRELGGSRRRG